MAFAVKNRRWLAGGLLGLGVLAPGVYYGVREHLPTSPSTALGRVGRALAEKGRLEESLSSDLATARSTLRGTTLEVFELAAALRGLDSDGVASWERAQAACRRLRFRECERRGLEEMRQRLALPDTGRASKSAEGEALLASALEELVWTHGSARQVRDVLQSSTVSSADTARSKTLAARTRLRLAVLAETPDARAALLSEVCAIDGALCDSLPQALERTAVTRPGAHEGHLLAPPADGPVGPPPPPTGPFAPRAK